MTRVWPEEYETCDFCEDGVCSFDEDEMWEWGRAETDEE
jgi:hypothetical protein